MSTDHPVGWHTWESYVASTHESKNQRENAIMRAALNRITWLGADGRDRDVVMARLDEARRLAHEALEQLEF